jgi:hypothetical protein
MKGMEDDYGSRDEAKALATRLLSECRPSPPLRRGMIEVRMRDGIVGGKEIEISDGDSSRASSKAT